MKRRLFFIFFGLIICLFALPKSASAALLYASPSSGSYYVGDSFSVSISVNTQGQAINSAQATVSFSGDLLEVLGISKSGIFTLWPVEPSYSNAAGTITFAGGLPSPGYTGGSGSIITIIFQAKAKGIASLSIGSASVLANDGLGTDILTGTGSGHYNISIRTLHLPEAPSISSLTHPDQSLWYADNSPIFSWSQEDGVVGFSYVFNDQEKTEPDEVRDSVEADVSYPGTGDGVWYFHVRAQNNDGWGPVANFRVQIDTVAPNPFTIELLDGKKTTVSRPKISFQSTDDLSGVHHYDLILDGGDPLGLDVGTTTPYVLPELPVGEHTLIVKAYDYAGNFSEASNSFIIYLPVKPLPPEKKPEVKVIENPIAEKIVRTFNNIAPAPVKKLTESIGKTINKIQENKTVEKAVNNVVEPVVVTSAVVTATGLAATTSAIQFYNLIYLFFRWGYFWLVPVFLGKKRKPWGTVFDSISARPIARAVVRIFTREFNKLKESQITDSQGRFGFIVDKGEYYVTVSAPGYIFPSHLLRTSAISQYDNIYRGDTLSVSGSDEGVLSINIPVDPNMKQVGKFRIFWMKILNIFGVAIEKFSLPLLIGGTLLSWASLILDPRLGNYIILAVYAVLIVFRYVVSRNMSKSMGMVVDAETKKPIEQAIIRIYNSDNSRIVWTRVSNSRGQYNALLSPGNYYLVIVKPGYEPFQSKVVRVTKRKGYIKFTAELQPKHDHGQKEESQDDLEGDQDIRLQPVERKEISAKGSSKAKEGQGGVNRDKNNKDLEKNKSGLSKDKEDDISNDDHGDQIENRVSNQGDAIVDLGSLSQDKDPR